MMHGGLECVTRLVQENGLQPDEIKSIYVRLDPTSSEDVFHVTQLENQIDLQFSVRYNIALAATGIPPSIQWQNPANMHDPKLLALMEKIATGVHPECESAMEKDSRARIVDVEIQARGKRFYKELRFIKGTATAGSAMEISDEERIRKFRDNTALILSARKIEAAMDALMHLDRAKDFRAVMALLHI